MRHVNQIAALQKQLDDFRSGGVSLAEYVRAAREASPDLLAALPPAFPEVWHNLLDRLESSALFAEESCSFSQKDLVDSLQMWLDKAAARLQTIQELGQVPRL